jgi:putative RNA 2'-phosphotransferase
LTRLLALALRHHPEQFGITLDPYGWTELDLLVESFRKRTPWRALENETVERLVAEDSVLRFEIASGRIRALYGHSVSYVLPGVLTSPPPLLFHATQAANFCAIKRSGISSGRRGYVHLTSSISYALRIKSSHENQRSPGIILAVQTALSVEPFYRASDIVWTTKRVEPSSLQLLFPDSSPAGFKLLPLLSEEDLLLTPRSEMASLERLPEA